MKPAKRSRPPSPPARSFTYAFGGIALGLGLAVYLFLTLNSAVSRPTASTVPYATTPTPPLPTAAPEATSAGGIADRSFAHTAKTAPSLGYTVTIPKDSRYEIGDQGDLVTIRLDQGLTITTCTACQMFIEGCNGLSDGNPEQGGCRIEPEDVGEGIILQKHYQLSDQSQILGYSGGTVFGGTNATGRFTIAVRVVTDKFRSLTKADKAILLPILKSIQSHPNPGI
jgi:hypothetical protein